MFDFEIVSGAVVQDIESLSDKYSPELIHQITVRRAVRRLADEIVKKKLVRISAHKSNGYLALRAEAKVSR